MSSVTVLTASPKQLTSIRSKSSPSSSFITLAPVTIAKSSIVSCFVGPKPGRSIKLTFMLPFTLFVSKAALGCCSKLPTISSDLFFFIQCSNIFCILRILGIADDVINISGLSSSATPLSLSVNKWGDFNGHGICIPSTTSTKVSPNGQKIIKSDYKAGFTQDRKYGYGLMRLKYVISIGAKVISRGLSNELKKFKPDAIIIIGMAKLFPIPILFSEELSKVKKIALFGDSEEYIQGKGYKGKLKYSYYSLQFKILKKFVYNLCKSCPYTIN